MEQTAREQVMKICEVLDNKKALEIKALYVADKTIVAEWFVICSGRAVTQVKTLCEELKDKAFEMGLEIRRMEGYHDGRWIVVDFGHILVHIFHPEEREYFKMERLWEDDPSNCIDYSKEHGES